MKFIYGHAPCLVQYCANRSMLLSLGWSKTWSTFLTLILPERVNPNPKNGAGRKSGWISCIEINRRLKNMSSLFSARTVICKFFYCYLCQDVWNYLRVLHFQSGMPLITYSKVALPTQSQSNAHHALLALGDFDWCAFRNFLSSDVQHPSLVFFVLFVNTNSECAVKLFHVTIGVYHGLSVLVSSPFCW